MIDQVTILEDSDLALPASSLDLSTRMRDLRARQGLKQSEVARRMRLDPSIPSLWEQGKRLLELPGLHMAVNQVVMGSEQQPSIGWVNERDGVVE